MKKICMTGLGIDKTNGVFVGGHVNSAVNLSKALAEKGFEVHIVTTPAYFKRVSSNKFIDTYELQEGVHIHRVNIPYNNALEDVSKKGKISIRYGVKVYYKIISAIRTLNKLEKFDIIHGHSGFPIVALIPEYFKILHNIPSVHTLYCPIENKLPQKIISKISFYRLDALIAISSNVKNSLKGVVPEGKVKIIPPLIDFKRFSSIKREYSKDSGNFTLLYVGNLSKSKGLHVLLEALAMVKSRYPDIKLLLGLDMPVQTFNSIRTEIHEKIEQLRLTDNIVPLGIIENLPAVMAESDIFVAPFTDTYGPADYPLVLLEAMASGLPVIATSVGGIPEIIKNGKNGLLIKPKDPKALAEAILYLFNEEERKTLGRNGRRLIEKISNKIVDKYIDLYYSITS